MMRGGDDRDRRGGDRGGWDGGGRGGDFRDRRGGYDDHQRGDGRDRDYGYGGGRGDDRRDARGGYDGGYDRDRDRGDRGRGGGDDRRRGDDSGGRGGGGGGMMNFQDSSDSSETEYTRKAMKWEVKLTPHQQLEALDLWLKANPEVAKDVENIYNRSRGISNKPPPNFQEGDWMCETCKQHNWKNRMDCRGCGAPAPADKIAELQAQKARTAVAQAARAPVQSARPGDWMCVGCTSSNYASKRQCHRCNMPKPNEWVCSVCNNMNVGADHANCSVCMGPGGAPPHAGYQQHHHHQHHHGGGAPPGGGYGGPGM